MDDFWELDTCKDSSWAEVLKRVELRTPDPCGALLHVHRRTGLGDWKAAAWLLEHHPANRNCWGVQRTSTEAYAARSLAAEVIEGRSFTLRVRDCHPRVLRYRYAHG
jgi:hypothetical protein